MVVDRGGVVVGETGRVGSRGAAVGLAELNGVLWNERDLLEDLLFALRTEQWVIGQGHGRWVGRAGDRVEEVNDCLRLTEVLRAAESAAVAADLGLGSDPSLTELAESAGEPWRTIFLEQRTGLRAAAGDIADATANTPRPGLSGAAWVALVEDRS